MSCVTIIDFYLRPAVATTCRWNSKAHRALLYMLHIIILAIYACNSTRRDEYTIVCSDAFMLSRVCLMTYYRFRRQVAVYDDGFTTR